MAPKVQAMVVVMLGLLLLAGIHQEADAQGLSIPMSLDSNGGSPSLGSISCKAMGNCENKDANRAPDQANKYTRGCSPIHQCRGE